MVRGLELEHGVRLGLLVFRNQLLFPPLSVHYSH